MDLIENNQKGKADPVLLNTNVKTFINLRTPIFYCSYNKPWYCEGQQSCPGESTFFFLPVQTRIC